MVRTPEWYLQGYNFLSQFNGYRVDVEHWMEGMYHFIKLFKNEEQIGPTLYRNNIKGEYGFALYKDQDSVVTCFTDGVFNSVGAVQENFRPFTTAEMSQNIRNSDSESNNSDLWRWRGRKRTDKSGESHGEGLFPSKV